MMLRLVVVFLVLAGASARGQQEPFLRGIDTVPLKPTAASRGGLALEGAAAAAPGSYRAALLLDYTRGLLALRLGEEKLGDLVPYRVDAHALLAWQPHRRLELAADVPFTLRQGDRFQLLRDVLAAPDFPGAAGVSATGLGDVRLLPRLLLLPPEDFPVGLALVAELRLPTGDAHSFLGERGVLAAPRLALERTLGPVRLLANVGARLRPRAQYLNLLVDDELTLGAGAELALPDVGRLTGVRALAEMHLATPLSAPFTFREADSLTTPWAWLAGLRARVQGPWSVELSVGRGMALEGGYGREAFRSLLSLRYEHDARASSNVDSDANADADSDEDGIPDGYDACPDEAGASERDGCPLQEKPPYVVIERERLHVKGDILFESGKAKIQQRSLKYLDEIATVLTEHPTLGPILIAGHTDNVGARAYNLDLSQRRAEAVRDYLIQRGVAASRLSARGFGLSQPLVPNDTPLGRAKNRRVEFRIIRRSP